MRLKSSSHDSHNQKAAHKLLTSTAKASALVKRIIKKGYHIMQINVTAPKETFEVGAFYQSASGSVLYVTPRKSPDADTQIMQFYGVKNNTPSTWTKRAMDDLNSAGGRFEKLEAGSTVEIELAAA
jgi:hypothetical protein